MLRISLFVITNLAVLAVLGIVMNLLGLNQPGSGMTGFIIYAGIFGMAGSFISLLMSKSMALRSTRAQVIDNPSNDMERWLVATVERQAQMAGIGMPTVAIFDSPAPNAFATGARKDAALVAVSTGLLHSMNKDEVEAVLGHEVSHVANGDMVTLTLIQGVLNTFVMVAARVVSSAMNERSQSGMGYYATYMIAQMVFGVLATIIVRWFSRYREFRADEGGARLAGRGKMIAALQRLQSAHEPARLPSAMQAFGISPRNFGGAGMAHLFMTHPPLEKRIEALQNFME